VKTETCLSFSALQRAENSSIRLCDCTCDWRHAVSVLFSEPKIPQCCWLSSRSSPSVCFSALQRAENSSIDAGDEYCAGAVCRVSVLFSEPKIPQYDEAWRRCEYDEVSVLFSEPKIPQFAYATWAQVSALQFQCSSASRKFLNGALELTDEGVIIRVSVLFSEPKIPQ